MTGPAGVGPAVEAAGLHRDFRARTGWLRRTAARDLAAGAGLAGALPRLGVEVLLAAAYALLAAVLLGVFERDGRRTASLDVL